MANNQLCGLDYQWKGTYTSEGCARESRALPSPRSSEPQSKPQTAVFGFESAPLNMHVASTLAFSLAANNLGPEGGSALAAILSQTKITDLKWATNSNPDHRALAFLSAPLDKHQSDAPSLAYNNLNDTPSRHSLKLSITTTPRMMLMAAAWKSTGCQFLARGPSPGGVLNGAALDDAQGQ